MLLPHFIIIGAMKSGTTSLYRYLKAHPEINMSSKKETNYFLHKNFYQKSTAWYSSHFTGEAKLRGEASTSYAKFPTHTKVAARIFSILPEVKLIYLVRDPLERLVSHYDHEVLEGREVRPFSKILAKIEETNYFLYSRYHFQLLQYLAFFSKGNVLVLTSEKLRERRNESLKSVYRFLSVKSFYEADIHDENFNTTESKIMKMKIPGMTDRMQFLLNGFQAFKSMELKEKYDHFRQENLKAYVVLKNDADRFRILTKNSCENWGI